MKHLFLLLFLGVTLAFSSCKNDPCENVLCESHAICQEGTCECEVGYKRNLDGRCVLSIDTDRDKFAKVWSVFESCSSGDYSFISTITKNPSEANQLIIYNFYDSYNSIYAVMTSANTFDIPLQVQGGNTISGNGIYAGGSLTIDYTIRGINNGNTNQCSATYN